MTLTPQASAEELKLNATKEAQLILHEAELKALLGGASSAQVASSSLSAQGNRGTALWPALLLFCVLALLGEGALTRR